MSKDTNEKIEKTLQYAAAHRLDALKLGQLLTQKHDITPVEATRWMDAYRKQYPKSDKWLGGLPKSQRTISSRVNKEAEEERIRLSQAETVVADLTADIRVTSQEVQVVLCPPNRDISSNYQPSILNRSAVKSFALAASEQNRAGKFKRCSPAFIQAVEAEVEGLLRQIGGNPPDKNNGYEDVPGEYSFINCKRAFAKAEEQFNLAIRKIILRRVKSQPSNGQTLK